MIPLIVETHHAAVSPEHQAGGEAQAGDVVVDDGRLFVPVMGDDVRGRPALQPGSAVGLLTIPACRVRAVEP